MTALNLGGTHGTSVTKAEQIKAQGFKKSEKIGRGGRGTYFWAYEHNSTLANELAKDWWKFGSRKGYFSGDLNPQCAVIHVNINILNGQFSDFESVTYKENLYKTVLERDFKNPKEIGQLYDMFVTRVERKIGESLAVIKASVPIVNFANKKISTFSRDYSCYVVRPNFENVIKIIDVRM